MDWVDSQSHNRVVAGITIRMGLSAHFFMVNKTKWIMSTQSLTALLATSTQAAGYELWGYEWLGGGDNRCLRVYIDHPNGISVDDCAAVSQHISAALTVEDPTTAYQLEVSSPGLERRLYINEHYQRFVGQGVKLQLRVPDQHGQRRFRGIIEKVTDDGHVTITTDEGSHVFAIESIEKARLIVQW